MSSTSSFEASTTLERTADEPSSVEAAAAAAAERDMHDDDEEEHSEDSSDSCGAVVVATTTKATITSRNNSNDNSNKMFRRFLTTLSTTPPTTRLLDRFLTDYVRFQSSAAHQERSLKLLQWTLWLIGYYKHNPQYHKLSLNVSWARYALRLLGFPASLEAARMKSWGSNNNNNNKIQSTLGQIMAWSMMLYYPLEHVALVGWMAPSVLPRRLLNQKTANQWSAYSCRCWMAYLVAEMAQSALRLRDLYRQERQLAESKKKDDYETNQEEQQQEQGLSVIQHSIRNEQLQLVRSLLFALPCIHWSLPHWDTDPWLKDGMVNGLMWTESVVSMYQSIFNFRREE